jgi:hypothetical protein
MQKRDGDAAVTAEQKRRIVHSKKLIRESKVMIDYSQQIISGAHAKDKNKPRLKQQS